MDKFLNNLRQKSFWSGFLNGLAAPAYLFGNRSYKMNKKTLRRQASGGIASDWKNIGIDLQKAMDKYSATRPI
ncbi:MAG: hypothetical protein FWH22_10350 [Fibromonadales bacterium]|nr:hypothetical protein [Fibromonadales bacterium]